MYYLSAFFDNKPQAVIRFETIEAALRHARGLYDEKSNYVTLSLSMQLNKDGLINCVTGEIDLSDEHDVRFFSLRNGMKKLVFIIDSEQSFADGLFELAAEGNPLPVFRRDHERSS